MFTNGKKHKSIDQVLLFADIKEFRGGGIIRNVQLNSTSVKTATVVDKHCFKNRILFNGFRNQFCSHKL